MGIGGSWGGGVGWWIEWWVEVGIRFCYWGSVESS